MIKNHNARFFYTHKRGETYSDIQDSIGVDEQTQRFAISDGVTNSFIPQVLSRILTNAFVSSGIAGFPPLNLYELFTIERGAYLNSLDEDQRFLQELVEEEFIDSAATFVGVEIFDNLIKWIVIGDSCLFILPDKGSLSCYCSNKSHTDNENKIHIVFDSHPARILSNGQTKGNIVRGELEFAPCWIILASDAMSAWIVETYNNKHNPALLLSGLSDNEDFERFVEQEYKEGRLKSDDESVVLVRLNERQGLDEPENNDTVPYEDTCPGKDLSIAEEHYVPCISVNCEDVHSYSTQNEQSQAPNKIELSSATYESSAISMSNYDVDIQNEAEQVYAEEPITGLPKESNFYMGACAQLIKSLSRLFSKDSDNNKPKIDIFMKSTKIWMAVAGILFIVLGIACICSPTETLFTLAWLIGIFTLLSGIAKLIFTFRTEGFLPNSGSRALSAVLQIILGCIILGNDIFVAISIPIIFALWLIVESVVIAVQSFDYKKVGFPHWWCILLLGILGAILGVQGLKNPDITAATLSIFIGIGIIAIGCAYLVALRGIHKFEKKVDRIKKTIGIDEQ